MHFISVKLLVTIAILVEGAEVVVVYSFINLVSINQEKRKEKKYEWVLA